MTQSTAPATLRPVRTLLPLLVLGACTTPVDPVPPLVFPADGQTDVGVFQALVLEGYGMNMPDDIDLPSFVTVIDQALDQDVPGTLTRNARGIEFLPDIPWAPDTPYLWTAVPPLGGTRQVEFDFPRDAEGIPLAGSAQFSTAGGIEPLQLSQGAGEFCVITSRPAQPVEIATLALQFGDERREPTTVEAVPPEDYEQAALPFGDRGVGVLCGPIPGEGRIERVWFGDSSLLVPEASASTASDAVATLRRLR